MSNSNARKDATLGMPHGTAAGRLRKMLLFDCLKRHSENICIRCLRMIESVEELSIEHLLPWEGVSAGLFWDLKNIAYSHMTCNRPNRPSGGRPEIKVPEGMTWCGVCESPKPSSEFTSGARNQCRVCKNKLNAQRVRHADIV